MHINARAAALMVSLLIFVASAASAAVPTTIALEGKLVTAAGGPVADGDYDVTFALYPSATAQQPAWSETAKVKFSAGLFSHALGSVKPLDAALVDATKAAWVGVKVGQEPELPRSPFRSVPFALRAGIADSAAALSCTACVPVSAMKFDGDIDLGGNSLKAKNVSVSGGVLAGTVNATTVTAGSFAGDGSKLTNLQIAGGKCQVGQVVVEVKASGAVVCADLPDGGGGGVLNTSFTLSASAAGLPTPIPDNTGTEAVALIKHSDKGAIKDIKVTVALANSDLSKVRVVLLPPDDKAKGLTLCDPCGKVNDKALSVTYTAQSQLASGSLGAYLGKPLAGLWTLKVLDTGFCQPQLAGNGPLCDVAKKVDGAVAKFVVAADVSSQQAAASKGTLGPGVFAGPPYQCTWQWLGQLYVDSKYGGLRVCDGSIWLAVSGSCGNGVVETGEECDDANFGTNDGCIPGCIKTSTSCNSACASAGSRIGGATLAKQLAADGAASDYFGYSVSLSGDKALVGAYQHDDKGGESGSAYVFERQGDGSWKQTAKLLADDGAVDDYFGVSVSLSGDKALVGAYYDNDKGKNSGSAYVFERQGDGSWKQTAKLLAADGAADDLFGRSVSLSGDKALVGAFVDDDKGSNSGSAYVFERQGDGSWKQTAKLLAADGATSDYFGWSVSLSGDKALVGARYDDDKGGNSGSAYVFERQGDGSWKQTAKLLAADGAVNDDFGTSVSLSGAKALVGARLDDDKGSSSGSAYVFERQGDGSWKQTAKLLAADGATGDEFGWSVSLSGDKALVGSYEDDDKGTNSGSAYVFERQGDGSWKQTAKLLAADGAVSDRFGYSVSLSGDKALVGAHYDDDKGSNSGSAYIIALFQPVCTEQGYCICKPGYAGADCGTKLAGP